MSAAALVPNPNFTGPSREGDLLAREVLGEEFATRGIVSRPLEEALAARWELDHGRAVVRTWEEPAEARGPYEERKALFDGAKGDNRQPSLVMDPDLAVEEIARLERTPNAAQYADRINELRTEVLGLEPRDFSAESDIDPILREDQTTKAEQRWKFFLSRDHHTKLAMIAAETDLEFLERIRHAPRKHLSPAARRATVDRIAAVKGS